ncbi:MAG: hypothetical protein R6T89_01760 [Candidatus Syntrophosphaera sp.]
MNKKEYPLEVPMPESMDKKKSNGQKNPAPPKTKTQATEIDPRHKVGLVEIVMILLLAGVVFIFIFGMRQMRREKAELLALQQKVESIQPHFYTIADSAKAYKDRDPFGAWPLTIEELNIPFDIQSPEYEFSFLENGTVILTTKEEFGKEGIKINYDINEDFFEIEDPEPQTKPVIKDEWLNL